MVRLALLILLMFICGLGLKAQNSCTFCKEKEVTEGACRMRMPSKSEYITIELMPNPFEELSENYQVCISGEGQRLKVMIAVYENVPFVYQVDCDKCDDPDICWNVRNAFFTTRVSLISDQPPREKLYVGVIKMVVNKKQ